MTEYSQGGSMTASDAQIPSFLRGQLQNRSIRNRLPFDNLLGCNLKVIPVGVLGGPCANLPNEISRGRGMILFQKTNILLHATYKL